MAGALYNADNVVVGHAVLYLARLASRATAPVGLVADTTPLFSESESHWPVATWTVAGATNEGYKVTVDTSTTTVTIEEQSTPVDEQIEAKTISIEAALAEDTLQSIQLAWGGGTITTAAAGPSTPGTQKMRLSDDVVYYTAVLETRNKYGLARRFYIPKATLVGSGDTNFRRSADKRTYPLRVQSLVKPSDIQIVEITAPATS